MVTFDPEYLDLLRQWRCDIHQNPEFGFEEYRTSQLVTERLREFGLTVVEGIGGTGVVGVLKQGESDRAIMLRADMDALRIHEAPTTPLVYASSKPGLMHACGHDGHTTMLLGAAGILAKEGGFDGTIYFVFQPAEEWGRGMLAMLDDGLLERFPADEAYGLHNSPGLPIGQFETCPGPFKSAEDGFQIRVKGKGGHSARPHLGNDALVAAAAIICSLQTIVSRTINPAETAVLSCTNLEMAGTKNVIPGEVLISGDCRSFCTDVSATIEREMACITEHVAQAHGCVAELTYTRDFIATVNDPELTAKAVQTISNTFGSESVSGAAIPGAGSEDFGQLLRRIPGCFMNIGNGDSASLHHAAYDFNDAAIPYGVGFFVALSRARLPLS